MIFDEIVDHCVDGTETMNKESLIVSNNRSKIRRKTTQVKLIMINWRYISTKWGSMKDVKECYPFQLAEYYHQLRIYQETEFTWWVPHVSKGRSKYFTITHKYLGRITKSVKEAISIVKSNGNTLWWEAIVKDTKK